MARRCRHQYRTPSDRSRFALLRLDPALTARTSVRSTRDTCSNTAQRFAKNPALFSVPRESFRNFSRFYQVRWGGTMQNFLLRLFELARLLVFLNRIASRIVNANHHSIMRASLGLSCKSWPRLHRRWRSQLDPQCYTRRLDLRERVSNRIRRLTTLILCTPDQKPKRDDINPTRLHGGSFR